MKVFTNLPQNVILSAVGKLEDFVKTTYGAAGCGILIDNGIYQSVIDDGFAVVEEFELEDELENTVIMYIKETSRKTNSRAGDGTTTAILIMCALIREAFKSTEYTIGYKDFHAVVDDLQKGLETAIKKIKKSAKQVTTIEELQKIALNAYKNPQMAKIIAEMVHKIGADGIISVEDSETFETSSSIVMGMSIDRGYISPNMGTDGGDTVLVNPKVVITDETISSQEAMVAILSPIVAMGTKEVLIIADSIDGGALNTLVINKIQSGLNFIAIKAPGFAEQRLEMLVDIATVTGANVLSSKLGRGLSSFNISDIGAAKKIIVGRDETTIIDGGGANIEVKKRTEVVKNQLKGVSPYDKARLQDRIAKLSGGVGVIKIGALTETESRSTKMKVDDAIHATQLALKDGVVKGGGVLMSSLDTGSTLLDSALKAPRAILEENGSKYISKDVEDACGVVIASIESAVSVASSLITCGGIITNKRKDEKDKDGE